MKYTLTVTDGNKPVINVSGACDKARANAGAQALAGTRTEHEKHLLRQMRDARLLAWGFVNGVIKWRPLQGEPKKGELCVDTSFYSASLDDHGLPVLNEATRKLLKDKRSAVAGPSAESME